MDRRHIPRLLLGIALVLVIIALCGCLRIPVTVHPPHSDDGQPLALPTAPTGRVQNADGTVDRLNPAFAEPRPGDHPVQPGMSVDWNLLIGGLLTLVTGGGLAYGRAASQRAKRAESNEDELYTDLKKTKESPHVAQ
jgi:hypothetical protein